MNILISYATNSGSTYDAVTVLSNTLRESGHTVTVKDALSTAEADFTANDVIVLATPSWDYDGIEGQPLEDMTKLVDSLKDKTFENKMFAILGTGDISYKAYCGAVDILETKVAEWKGKKVVDSLKIDRYYTQPENPQKVTDWAKNLAAAIPH